jgi:hypothetical protein
MHEKIRWSTKRLIVVPFECAIGFVCVWSGFLALFKIGVVADPLKEILGPFSILFNVIYLVSGIMLYIGIALNKRMTEAFGLILIAMSLVVRLIVALYVIRLDERMINNYAFSVSVIIACGIRFYTLFKGLVLVEAKNPELPNVKTVSAISNV